MTFSASQIEREWDGFRSQILPADTPEIMLRWARMCFTAGRYSALGSLEDVQDPAQLVQAVARVQALALVAAQDDMTRFRELIAATIEASAQAEASQAVADPDVAAEPSAGDDAGT